MCYVCVHVPIKTPRVAIGDDWCMTFYVLRHIVLVKISNGYFERGNFWHSQYSQFVNAPENNSSSQILLCKRNILWGRFEKISAQTSSTYRKTWNWKAANSVFIIKNAFLLLTFSLATHSWDTTTLIFCLQIF